METGDSRQQRTKEPKKARAWNSSKGHLAIPEPPTHSGSNLPRPYLSE